MRKTTLICQGCKTEILSVESCKDLKIACPVCKSEILLNVENGEAVIKARPPKKETTAKSK